MQPLNKSKISPANTMVLWTLLTVVNTEVFPYDFQLLHNQLQYNLKINVKLKEFLYLFKSFFFKRSHELSVPILENILTIYANFENLIGYQKDLFGHIYRNMMNFYEKHMVEVRKHKEKYVA